MKRTVKRAAKWLSHCLGRTIGGRYRRALFERKPVCAAHPGGPRERAGPKGRAGAYPLQPVCRTGLLRG